MKKSKIIILTVLALCILGWAIFELGGVYELNGEHEKELIKNSEIENGENETQGSYRHKVTMQNENNKQYEIYLVAENEEEKISEKNNPFIEKGKRYFQGDYQLAVKAVGEKLIAQDNLSLWSGKASNKQVFIPDKNMVYVIKNDSNFQGDLLVVEKASSTKGVEAQFFTLKKDKLMEVNLEIDYNVSDFYGFVESIEYVSPFLYRSVEYSNDDLSEKGESLHFKLWEYEPNTLTLNLLKEKVYSAEDYSKGEYYLENWKEDNTHFIFDLPLTIEINDSLKKDASDGTLPGISLKLGMEKEEIFKTVGEPNRREYNSEGVISLVYKDYILEIDNINNRLISMIATPSPFMFEDLEMYLGKPRNQKYNEEWNERIIEYIFGNHSLIIKGESEQPFIYSVKLTT